MPHFLLEDRDDWNKVAIESTVEFSGLWSAEKKDMHLLLAFVISCMRLASSASASRDSLQESAAQWLDLRVDDIKASSTKETLYIQTER